MQLDIEAITRHVKCGPYKPEPTQVHSIPDLFELWLPPIIPEVVKEDFLAFFSRKITGQLDWLRRCVDTSFTSFKVPFTRGGYRGLADFIFWDDSLGGCFLERALPLLHSIASCSDNTLTVEQFVALMTDICQWANFPLTPLDIGIITTINRMPTITTPALARLLQASYKNTRAHWKRLRMLNIFRVTALPNYHSIGLQPVIIELRDTRCDIKSPYLLSKLRLTGQSKLALYVMVIPDDKLGTLTRTLDRQVGTTYSIHLVKNQGHTISFTHYHHQRHNWNIDWRKLFVGVHLLHRESEGDSEPDLYDSPQPSQHPYFLDEKDKQLIPLLMADARSKLELLATRLGMSLSQMSRRKSKLIDIGALRLETVMRRVGLVEDIVLRINDEDPRLLGVVRELPQTWVKQLVNIKTGAQQHLIYSTLPAGSFVKMRYYLTQYLQSKSEILISDPESGGWPLSFDNYDTELGQWLWREPTIMEEVSGALSLRSSPQPVEKSQSIERRL